MIQILVPVYSTQILKLFSESVSALISTVVSGGDPLQQMLDVGVVIQFVSETFGWDIVKRLSNN